AREAARAEVRAMTIKIQELQQQLQDARDGRLGLLQRDDQMTHELEGERQARQRLEQEIGALQKLPSASIDEKTLRDKIEAEWSDKLQTIVNHIASDHESDIGKAIEEREAARAEVRNLNIKMTALQQKLDSERRGRESLQVRYREVEERMRNAPTQPMMALIDPLPPPPPSPPAPPPEPQEEQQARAN